MNFIILRSLFDEMDTVDGVITNVMVCVTILCRTQILRNNKPFFYFLGQTYAKRLVDADRCAMFLTDEKSNELHADLFDEGKLDENGCGIFSKGKEIRYDCCIK